jgi:hypothetical protein
VEDDQRSVLENSPISCHFAALEEDLFKIGAVCIKHLATLRHQGVKVGLEDVALVGVRSIGPGVSTLHA